MFLPLCSKRGSSSVRPTKTVRSVYVCVLGRQAGNLCSVGPASSTAKCPGSCNAVSSSFTVCLLSVLFNLCPPTLSLSAFPVSFPSHLSPQSFSSAEGILRHLEGVSHYLLRGMLSSHAFSSAAPACCRWHVCLNSGFGFGLLWRRGSYGFPCSILSPCSTYQWDSHYTHNPPLFPVSSLSITHCKTVKED